jgi:hypothetical protein
MFSNTLSPCSSLNVSYQVSLHTEPQIKLCFFMFWSLRF